MVYLKFVNKLVSMNIISGILLASCVNSGTYQIFSNPEGVEVYKVDENGTQSSMGNTPLIVNSNQIVSSEEEQLLFFFQKEDYFPQSLLVPKTSLQANHKIHITLLEKPKMIIDEQCKDLPKDAYQELARGIAEAQSLITRKDWNGAQNKLQVLVVKYPFVSVLHDLLGNVYFLQKDLSKALMAYERSASIWPYNQETTKLI